MDASQARPFLRLLGGCKPVLLGAFRAYRCRPGRGNRVVFDGLAAEYTMIAKLLQVSLRGDLADLIPAVLVQRHLDSIHMITSLRTTQPTHTGAAMPSRRSRWQTSHRRDRLPHDWQRIRAAVRARANGRCQAKQHANGCNGIGTDCDHIIPGDDNSLDNLQWLSSACHKAKTARETAARNAWYRETRLHPVEKNPGSIQSGVGGTSPGAVG